MVLSFGRDEITYLRAELDKAHQRNAALVAQIVSLRRDGFVAPEPQDTSPMPPEVSEVAPSVEVVIEEFAELSPRPEEVRRQLTKFAALKSTQGKTEQEIVALIRKGGDVADDDVDEEAYI